MKRQFKILAFATLCLLAGCDNSVRMAADASRRADSLQALLDRRDREISYLRLLVAADSVKTDTVKSVAENPVTVKATMPDSTTIAGAVLMLDEAYYAIGSKMELERSGVIVRNFPLIGRRSVNTGCQLDKFRRTDPTAATTFRLNRTGVRMLSSHPEGSYQLIYSKGGKLCRELRIIDPQLFWSRTKVLVVTYN